MAYILYILNYIFINYLKTEEFDLCCGKCLLYADEVLIVNFLWTANDFVGAINGGRKKKI